LQTARPIDIIKGHARRSRLMLSMGSDTASQWNLAALSNQAAGSTAALICPGEPDLRSEVTLCRFPPPLQIYWLWFELLYSAPNHRPISKHRRNTFAIVNTYSSGQSRQTSTIVTAQYAMDATPNHPGAQLLIPSSGTHHNTTTFTQTHQSTNFTAIPQTRQPTDFTAIPQPH
jgi:hypothetical protein